MGQEEANILVEVIQFAQYCTRLVGSNFQVKGLGWDNLQLFILKNTDRMISQIQDDESGPVILTSLSSNKVGDINNLTATFARLLWRGFCVGRIINRYRIIHGMKAVDWYNLVNEIEDEDKAKQKLHG